LSPIRSSAGYTIDMHESDFSEATGASDRSRRRVHRQSVRARKLDNEARRMAPAGCLSITSSARARSDAGTS